MFNLFMLMDKLRNDRLKGIKYSDIGWCNGSTRL